MCVGYTGKTPQTQHVYGVKDNGTLALTDDTVEGAPAKGYGLPAMTSSEASAGWSFQGLSVSGGSWTVGQEQCPPWTTQATGSAGSAG
jgi:hypothetical protein